MKLERLIILIGLLVLAPDFLSAQMVALDTKIRTGQPKMSYSPNTGLMKFSTVKNQETRIPGLRSSLLKPHKLIQLNHAENAEADTTDGKTLDEQLKPDLQYNPGSGMSFSGQVKKRNMRNSGLANSILTPYELIDTGEPFTSKEESEAKKLTVSVESKLLGQRKMMQISGHGLDQLSIGLEITDLTGNKVKFEPADISFDQETGLLKLSLLIKQGFYEFKIPTASGTIKESLYISW